MSRIPYLLAAGIGGYYLRRALKPRYDFRDRHVVITGGSRGLGFVLGRQLAEAGAHLSICSRNAEELSRAGADLNRRGAHVMAMECDVTDREQLREFLHEARRAHGPIDVLINNAGIIGVGPFEEMDEDDFRRSLDTHFWAALHAMQEVIPEMTARKQGRIVNIASIAGKIAFPHAMPYTAGKFALVGLSSAMGIELAKHNIAVTTVCPGLMRTGSHLRAKFKGRNEEEYAWFALGNGIPGASMSAEAASRQILRACALGDAELVVGLPAQLAVWMQAVAPALGTRLLRAVNGHVMPAPGGIGHNEAEGGVSRGKLPTIFTVLTDRAAEENNETGMGNRPALNAAY